jgi:hypothetical protein
LFYIFFWLCQFFGNDSDLKIEFDGNEVKITNNESRDFSAKFEALLSHSRFNSWYEIGAPTNNTITLKSGEMIVFKIDEFKYWHSLTEDEKK